jgi:hypothetical protein
MDRRRLLALGLAAGSSAALMMRVTRASTAKKGVMFMSRIGPTSSEI